VKVGGVQIQMRRICLSRFGFCRKRTAGGAAQSFLLFGCKRRLKLVKMMAAAQIIIDINYFFFESNPTAAMDMWADDTCSTGCSSVTRTAIQRATCLLESKAFGLAIV